MIGNGKGHHRLLGWGWFVGVLAVILLLFFGAYDVLVDWYFGPEALQESVNTREEPPFYEGIIYKIDQDHKTEKYPAEQFIFRVNEETEITDQQGQPIAFKDLFVKGEKRNCEEIRSPQ
jgi:hypothetical protein